MTARRRRIIQIPGIGLQPSGGRATAGIAAVELNKIYRGTGIKAFAPDAVSLERSEAAAAEKLGFWNQRTSNVQ